MDSRYVLKLKSGGDLRRVNLAKLEMVEVKLCVDRLFPGIENYVLFYTDDEGDRIVVDSDLELEEAASLGAVPANGRKIIRLEIETSSQPSSSTTVRPQGDDAKSSNKEKEEETSKEEAKKKAENTLSSFVGDGLVDHPVIRESAQTIVELVGPFEGFLGAMSSMRMGSNFGISGDSQFEGMDLEGLELLDLGELFGMVKDLAQGRDPIVSEDLAKHECFQGACTRIGEKREELLAKLGRVEKGLQILKEKGCQEPKWVQLVGLWREDGDVEKVMVNVRDGRQSASPFLGQFRGMEPFFQGRRCGMRRMGRRGRMGGMGQFFQGRCGMPMDMGMGGISGMGGNSTFGGMGDENDEALQAALWEAMGFEGESSSGEEGKEETGEKEIERRELSEEEKKELDDVFDDCFNQEEQVKEEEPKEVEEEEGNAEQLSVLLSMGIDRELARELLQKSRGNLEMALEQFLQA